jgi:predicted HAD superfamily hydrolase
VIASVQKIAAMLEGPVPDIVSFDVFDTLLVRKTDPPERSKQYAARVAVERRLVDISISELLSVRDRIELKIRNDNSLQGFDPEVSIVEIFSELSMVLVGNTSLTKELVAVEYEVESMLIEPMPGMRSILRSLKGRCRIIAISDTYLPVSIVERLLAKAGYEGVFETIFCSCDYLLSKGSGRLFEKVLEKMEGMSHQMLHIGDNFVSDYFVPKIQGIKAHLLYDRWNLRRRCKLRHFTISGNCSEYWLGLSVHSSISEVRRRNVSDDDGFFGAWGKEVVAPLLAGFVHALVDRVRARSVKHLYFVAREGFLIKKMFESLWQTLYPDDSPPQLTYLCISRLTSFVASIKCLGDREWTLACLGVQKLEHFIGRLGIQGMPELTRLLEEYNLNNFDLITNYQTRIKLELLCGDERFRRMVTDNSKAMRNLLRAYLEGLGFFSASGRVFFVDVGWLGTIQDCLEHAFIDDDSFPELEGVYVGLNPPVHRFFNRKIGLIYDYRYALPEEMAIGLFRESLEFTCRSLHGTTLNYRRNSSGEMTPIFASCPSSVDERKRIMRGILGIQKGVMEYLSDYASMVKLTGITSQAMVRFAIQHYDAKISFPESDLLDVMAVMENSDDFGTSGKRKIIGKLSLNFFLRPRAALKDFLDTPWREASLAKTRIPFVNSAYFALKRLVCWKRILPKG